MSYQEDYPTLDACDGCGATVGGLTLYEGLFLCRGCLAKSVAYDVQARYPGRET
jgi:hypothetical protein